MRVASATIFKDEYDNLKRMLNSLPGRVDEAIVVCTAHQPPPRPEWAAWTVWGTYPWDDSFSNAKNAALHLASGVKADWTIILDSDEELWEAEPGAFRKACEEADAAGAPGFGVDVCNVNVLGEIDFLSKQWRVLKMNQGTKFLGRVHEQLTHPSGPATIPFIPSVRILHHGYNDPKLLFGPKRRRNNHLLRLAAREDRHNDALWFQLGAQMLLNGTPKRAVPCLRHAIDLWKKHKGGHPEMGHVRPMFYRLAGALYQAGMYDQVMGLYGECPNQAVGAEILYFVGMACFRRERPSDAEHFLALAPTAPMDDLEMRWRPLWALAGLYEALRLYDKAFDMLKRLHGPLGRNNDPDVILALAGISKLMGQNLQAVKWADLLIDGDFPEEHQQRARAIKGEPQTTSLLIDKGGRKVVLGSAA